MSLYKKPPDKYKSIKCSLRSITNDFEFNKLFDVTVRTHKLVIHSYQFLRLWLLDKYSNNLDIPIIDVNTIKMAFKSLSLPSRGPKPKGSNLDLYNEFINFHDTTYKHLNFNSKSNSKNLSHILSYMVTDMVTNIENNIKLNFFSYIKRFVNSSFKKHNGRQKPPNEILNNIDNDKTFTRKELNKDLFIIKEDLFNNTLKCNEKYHNWINIHRNNILPCEFKTTFSNYKSDLEYDIQINPQSYLKYMIYMCLELEKLENKSFQFFPLRTDIIPKYIPIDTATLIDLFEKNNPKYLKDIENNKVELWSKYFNLDNPVFKQSKYSFDFRITTDCKAVSIQLIHSSFIQKEKEKKLNMKKKRLESKLECKDMSQEEKEQFKNDKNIKKKEKTDEYKLQIKKNKEEFKKISKEEKKEIQKNKYIEFPYLEDLSDLQLNELKDNNYIVVDPGKRCLLYMKNKDGKRLRYTNRTHITKTKRLKYQRLIKNYKDKNNITEIELELTKYNSKTCNYDKFKEYITNKNKINEELFIKYNNDIFRKYKWYGYINRKRAETDLVRTIKTTFGNDSILITGDWSDKLCANKLKYMSTPNLGLKRKIAEYIKTYNIDEYRTSSLNYKTEEKNENLYLPDKKGKSRRIHSILTYKTESNRMGCINRDENSVNNMKKLVEYYLNHKTRPEKYKRTKIKDDNPVTGVKCHQAFKGAITPKGNS